MIATGPAQDRVDSRAGPFAELLGPLGPELAWSPETSTRFCSQEGHRVARSRATVSEIVQFDTAIAEVSEGAISSLITRDVARANHTTEIIRRLEDDDNRIEDRLSHAIQAPLCRSLIRRIIHGLREIASRQRSTIAEIAINGALEESDDHTIIDVGFVANC